MSEYIFNKSWCKGCGVCVAFCPKKALTLDEIAEKMERDPEKCIYCGLCEHYCPDLAITVVKDKKPKEAK
ncbi:MAG: 4Fe-4S binding protein [Desulfovibrio sp.]|jgi:2-oxoglutarate ferredoxin oxidoreductase subunit delta|nr:4Fe-4S binding protein [Desulfovibrio sp.]MBQ1420933.1 4Fe-4S binding protein [Desulfovibrio sp.]MBQ1539452.1 4Fe-4S binding protein [Desulfovibrio sp.]MBQ1846128.1 4Fe-4S binding protein [Desulfovibrio sp.]MBQ2477450.1 4Fe-4S binding protein [Desulfovibrio sp.]